MKKTLRILLGRIGFCGLLIALQAIILIVVILRFQQYFVYFYALCILLSVLVVMVIVNSRIQLIRLVGLLQSWPFQSSGDYFIYYLVVIKRDKSF